MKRTFLGLLAPVLLLLGAGAPALAVESSSFIEGADCYINLDVLGALPAEYTGDTVLTVIPGGPIISAFSERHCTGSAPSVNTQILCEVDLNEIDPSASWPDDVDITVTGFDCRVDRGPCGGLGLGIADTSKLSIDDLAPGAGPAIAKLTCNLN